MCFITRGFIETAKYHMGCIGFNVENNEEFTLKNLQEVVAEDLLLVQNLMDAFNINYHYQWIRKKYNKIYRALQSKKWEELDYADYDVELSDSFYSNVDIITNAFSPKLIRISCEDNGIKYYDVKKAGYKGSYELLKDKEPNAVDVSYVYKKEYLSSLKRKKDASKDEAVAEINIYPLDYKRNKWIAYVVYLKDDADKPYIISMATHQISSTIDLKKGLQFVAASSIMRTTRR